MKIVLIQAYIYELLSTYCVDARWCTLHIALCIFLMTVDQCLSEWIYESSDHPDFYHARWWPDHTVNHVYFDLMARVQPSQWIGVGFSQEMRPKVFIILLAM